MRPQRCSGFAVSGISSMPDSDLFSLAAAPRFRCPFFLSGGTPSASGRGEKIQPLPDLPSGASGCDLSREYTFPPPKRTAP